MAYSSITTAHLSELDKQVDYVFELRTNFPESSTWQEFAFVDFTLTHDIDSPATLNIELVNSDLHFSDEQSTANRVQLLAEARLRCSLAGETETLFQGRVYRVEPRDYRFVLLCQDWLALVHECECEVSLAPAETDEIEPARQLVLVANGEFGSVFGFSYSGGGDPAFSGDGARRRSWAAGDIQLWYDAAATEEVPPQHYAVNLTGGTATILEDTTGRTYYASGVRCYREGTLDWAQVFEAALTYPAALGGMGLSSGDMDMPDTGIDVAGPVYFQGRVGDLIKQILAQQQANMRLWYSSRGGSFMLRIVEQAAAGNEEWELLHAKSIAQPRDIRELYSRIVVSGLSERPRNALTEDSTSLTPRAGAGTWFAWDGLNVGPDSSFTVVGPHLYDGDANLGAAVHNLPASENGGSDRYDSWYDFVIIDLGDVRRINRVRLTFPGSRNANASAGHQGLFWPGARLLGSVDGVDYRLLSAQLSGRFAPGEQSEARGQDVLYPKVRYIKVLLGAYKHGFENQDDPSIGLAELEVYTTEEYRIVKEIDGFDEGAQYVYRDGTTWNRYHPGLWARLGGRQRSKYINRAGEYNEFLAHDYALDSLAESVRLFQQVRYGAVCDPRVELYDTVVVADELNGCISSILVERVVLNPGGTAIYGTDYHSAALGA